MQYIEGYHAYHRYFSSFTVFEMVLVTNNQELKHRHGHIDVTKCHVVTRDHAFRDKRVIA